MRALRHSISTAALAAIVFGVGFACAVETAAAQTSADTKIAPPPSAAAGVTTRSRSQPPAAPTADDTADAAPSPLRPSAHDIDDTSATPPAAAPGDGDDPAKWPDRVPADGVLAETRPSNIPTDGRLDDSRAPDGPARAVTALADADASLADYDRLAFQIELDPATDKRPARLARLEPYSPRGVRSGSWVILPEIETGIGYTSNAFRASSARGSSVFDVRPTLRAVTDWRQHAIDLRATGLFSRYADEPLADEKSYAFEARGRLDLGRRTNIEVLAARRHDVDSPGDPLDLTAERGRPEADANVAAATFNHRFNRLTIQLRGAVTDTDAKPGCANDGSLRSNAERDNLRREAAIRASWEFKPSLAVFAEYAANTYDFKTIASDGFDRDSSGERIRAGVSFGNTSRIWRGEIGVGYGHQNARDANLANADGIILDANLAWRPSELTSVLFTAKSDFTTSTDPGQALGRTQSYGVELRHAFRRHLIGSAGIKRQTTDYDGTAIKEVETTAELGAEYWLNQATSVTARYSHVNFDTTTANGDYTVDTARLGLRWRP